PGRAAGERAGAQPGARWPFSALASKYLRRGATESFASRPEPIRHRPRVDGGSVCDGPSRRFSPRPVTRIGGRTLAWRLLTGAAGIKWAGRVTKNSIRDGGSAARL